MASVLRVEGTRQVRIMEHCTGPAYSHIKNRFCLDIRCEIRYDAANCDLVELLKREILKHKREGGGNEE